MAKITTNISFFKQQKVEKLSSNKEKDDQSGTGSDCQEEKKAENLQQESQYEANGYIMLGKLKKTLIERNINGVIEDAAKKVISLKTDADTSGKNMQSIITSENADVISQIEAVKASGQIIGTNDVLKSSTTVLPTKEECNKKVSEWYDALIKALTSAGDQGFGDDNYVMDKNDKYIKELFALNQFQDTINSLIEKFVSDRKNIEEFTDYLKDNLKEIISTRVKITQCKKYIYEDSEDSLKTMVISDLMTGRYANNVFTQEEAEEIYEEALVGNVHMWHDLSDGKSVDEVKTTLKSDITRKIQEIASQRADNEVKTKTDIKIYTKKEQDKFDKLSVKTLKEFDFQDNNILNRISDEKSIQKKDNFINDNYNYTQYTQSLILNGVVKPVVNTVTAQKENTEAVTITQYFNNLGFNEDELNELVTLAAAMNIDTDKELVDIFKFITPALACVMAKLKDDVSVLKNTIMGVFRAIKNANIDDNYRNIILMMTLNTNLQKLGESLPESENVMATRSGKGIDEIENTSTNSSNKSASEGADAWSGATDLLQELLEKSIEDNIVNFSYTESNSNTVNYSWSNNNYSGTTVDAVATNSSGEEVWKYSYNNNSPIYTFTSNKIDSTQVQINTNSIDNDCIKADITINGQQIETTENYTFNNLSNTDTSNNNEKLILMHEIHKIYKDGSGKEEHIIEDYHLGAENAIITKTTIENQSKTTSEVSYLINDEIARQIIKTQNNNNGTETIKEIDYVGGKKSTEKITTKNNDGSEKIQEIQYINNKPFLETITTKDKDGTETIREIQYTDDNKPFVEETTIKDSKTKTTTNVKCVYSYDENGNVDEFYSSKTTTITDSNGTTIIDESMNKKITTVTDKNGNSYRTTIKTHDNITEITHEELINGEYLPTRTVKMEGNKEIQIIESEYDSKGELVSETIINEDGTKIIKTYKKQDNKNNIIEVFVDNNKDEVSWEDKNGEFHTGTHDDYAKSLGYNSWEDYQKAKAWGKLGFDSEDDYNLAKALGYDDNAKEFYNKFGHQDNYIPITDKDGNAIGRSCLDEEGNVIKVIIKTGGFIRIQNTKDGSHETISPDGIHCKYEYVNGKETLISATDKNGKDVTADVQRAIDIENTLKDILSGKYGSGSTWNRDAAISALVNVGAEVWSLSRDNSPMFTQAINDMINAYKNGTIEQYIDDVFAGKYGGSLATGSSGGSGSSSGSGSGDWNGSYTPSWDSNGNPYWTDANGNTTTVDPLSGIDWGHGYGPNMTSEGIFSGSSDYTTGNSGSHY